MICGIYFEHFEVASPTNIRRFRMKLCRIRVSLLSYRHHFRQELRGGTIAVNYNVKSNMLCVHFSVFIQYIYSLYDFVWLNGAIQVVYIGTHGLNIPHPMVTRSPGILVSIPRVIYLAKIKFLYSLHYVVCQWHSALFAIKWFKMGPH